MPLQNLVASETIVDAAEDVCTWPITPFTGLIERAVLEG
jgi:hypothetical protein